MGAFLTIPLTSKSLHRQGNEHFRVGSASMQGWRDNMEDADSVVLSLPGHNDTAFFGIFDGHCGSGASKYCAENMAKEIDKVDDFSDHEAITKQIVDLDNEFLTTKMIEDGTTCIFSLINVDTSEEEVKYNLSVGNIGDSRIVLARGGKKAIAMTEDHKPKDPEEEGRIQAAGGFVKNNRVRGYLALSRAIGDRSYKVPDHFTPDKYQVICIPDYRTETATKEDFLFLACDGIYEGDIYTRQQIIDFISQKLQETDDLAMICADVLDSCLAKGSRDNMSAMIVQFKNGEDYNTGSEYLPGPYDKESQHFKFQTAYANDAERNGFSLEEAIDKYEKSQKA